MIRRTARWWIPAVTLTTLLLVVSGLAVAAPADTFDFLCCGDNPILEPDGETAPLQAPPVEAPYYLPELSSHQQIAILKIYGETTLEAMPEQQAVSRAVATFAADRVHDRPTAVCCGVIPWSSQYLPGWMWTRDWPTLLPATGLSFDLSVHERAALHAAFGTDDLALLDAAADLPALASPVIISTSSSAINAAVVSQMVARMTVHEQLALRAIFGDVRLEPSPVQNAIAPYAELVTKGEVTPATLPWRPRLRTETVARLMDVHEQAAILAIYGDGFAPRDPERQAVAPVAALLNERAVFEKLAPAALVDTMSVHEQAAVRAIFGEGFAPRDVEQRAVAPLATIIDARIATQERLAPAALVDTMSVHEQAAIRAVFGEGFAPRDVEQRAAAPLATIIDARIATHERLNPVELVGTLSVHEQAAILAVLGDGLTDEPERAAVAPFAGMLAARLPCTGMDAVLAELSVHERCAVLAICGNPLWANDPEQCAAHTLASLIKDQQR